jgi:hypothetical protein
LYPAWRLSTVAQRLERSIAIGYLRRGHGHGVQVVVELFDDEGTHAISLTCYVYSAKLTFGIALALTSSDQIIHLTRRVK